MKSQEAPEHTQNRKNARKSKLTPINLVGVE